MSTALHTITITMKRIPIATAMERARTNGDPVKEKKKVKDEKEDKRFWYFHI